jgi:hypothetical protein
MSMPPARCAVLRRPLAARLGMVAVAALLAGGTGTPLRATDAITTPDAVVNRGMQALLTLQQPDGSFDSAIAITSLCGMAMLAGGSTPTRGPYHEQSARALHYVLDNQDKLTGYLGADMGNMYSHGFATLYLAECYGMATEGNLRRALEAAIDLIYRAQNNEGGWRYSPSPLDADISVTICQIMALRAANNVGIGGQATQQAIARAIAYVRNCANGDGSFSYQAGIPPYGISGVEAVPRCAAGCMSLIGSGITDLADPVLGPSLRFLRSHVLAHLQSKGDYYWYGEYYAAQALFHSPDSEDWDTYWQEAWPIFARLQESDGLWSRSDTVGTAYNSAMALIILQIPNNYLPIFQR